MSVTAPDGVQELGDSHDPGVLDLVKPRLRGRLHQLALYVAAPAGLLLLLHAGPGRARVAAAVYAVTLLLLYAISSTYHVREWDPAVRLRWRRADRATIYVFIAGSYTPVCLLVLHGAMSVGVLVGVWFGALLGVAAQVSRRVSRWRVVHALYLILGWLVIIGAPQLVRGLSGGELALLFAGGLLYTVGSLVLATKWPDPHPEVFGFHEVWHAMVVAACVCHYALIWQLVR